MSEKHGFLGLTFNYDLPIKEFKFMKDKFKTIEDFVNHDFSDFNVNHSYAPKESTKIYNIRWNRNIVKLDNVETVKDLQNFLRSDDAIVTSKKIKRRD